jgi:chromosome segregation ATPase
LYVNKEDNFLEKNFEIFSFEIIYLNSKTKSLFNFFIVNEDYENFLKILNKNKQKNILYEKINFFLLFENNIKNQINKIPTLQIDILNNIEKYKNDVLNNKKTDEENNNLLFDIYKDLVDFYSLEEINIINNNLNYDFLKNILNKFNFLNKEINKLLKQCKYEIEILKLINKKIENDFNIENFYLEFNNNFEDFNKNKNINKNNLFEITLNNNFNILNIKKEIKLNINYFNFEFISNKKINNNLNKNNFLIDKKYYFSILCQNKINYLDKIKKLENNLKEKELKIKNYSNNKNKIDEKINKYEELIKKYEDEIKNKENEILKLKNELKNKILNYEQLNCNYHEIKNQLNMYIIENNGKSKIIEERNEEINKLKLQLNNNN